ncbi:hypothetical protein HRI_004166800 [Hibiscus trionum]|uniref:Uncharacterized protein n=1 Tax=Hibiscus trionum TaxID=183268 RepID=A0A9W7MPR9_HIBTR|nr:hypothetical protein HRI_004166800 [Hibiscus trionum]
MVDERTDTNSLCEKSMKVVVNIFKLSSFSIARMSLGETTATKSLPSAVTNSVVDGRPPRSSSRMSEKLQSLSTPYSFVMQPERRGNYEPRVVGEEKRDEEEGKFAAYIRKVHEKNRGNLHEAAKLSPYILPPPPTPLRRKK